MQGMFSSVPGSFSWANLLTGSASRSWTNPVSRSQRPASSARSSLQGPASHQVTGDSRIVQSSMRQGDGAMRREISVSTTNAGTSSFVVGRTGKFRRGGTASNWLRSRKPSRRPPEFWTRLSRQLILGGGHFSWLRSSAWEGVPFQLWVSRDTVQGCCPGT